MSKVEMIQKAIAVLETRRNCFMIQALAATTPTEQQSWERDVKQIEARLVELKVELKALTEIV